MFRNRLGKCLSTSQGFNGYRLNEKINEWMGYQGHKEKRPNSLLFSSTHCLQPTPTVTQENGFMNMPLIFLPPNVPDPQSPSAQSPPPSFSLAGLSSHSKVTSPLTLSHRQNFLSPLCTHSSLAASGPQKQHLTLPFLCHTLLQEASPTQLTSRIAVTWLNYSSLAFPGGPSSEKRNLWQR